jgi:hypothetical protein
VLGSQYSERLSANQSRQRFFIFMEVLRFSPTERSEGGQTQRIWGEALSGANQKLFIAFIFGTA